MNDEYTSIVQKMERAEPEVIEECIIRLGQLGDPRAKRLLRDLLESSETTERNLMRAACALGDLGVEDSTEVLWRLILSEGPERPKGTYMYVMRHTGCADHLYEITKLLCTAGLEMVEMGWQMLRHTVEKEVSETDCEAALSLIREALSRTVQSDWRYPYLDHVESMYAETLQSFYDECGDE